MWLDRESEIDLLAYSPFAELITNIVADERLNPLTIGLLGSWGVGKSTLLKLIEVKIHELDKEHKSIVCIPLNSWMFEGYDDAKSAIMESLLRTLLENQPAFETLKDKVKSLIGRINFIRLGAIAIKHGIPLALSAINPALSTITAAQYLSADKQNELKEDFKGILKEKNDETSVENIRLFRKEFEDLIIESDIKNLVVMIDDLDRCSPDRIIETLEAIKLFLSVPKTTFVIAVDTQVIKYSVENKYPKISEDTIRFSDNYIEKIIQVPINIPELSETDIKNYLLLLICELFLTQDIEARKKGEDNLSILLNRVRKEEIFIYGYRLDLEFIQKSYERYGHFLFKEGKQEEFENIFKIISNTCDVISCILKGNPRQAKRFLNSFLIRKNLADIYYKADRSFNYSILAKLMSLEYIDDKLFKELYKWSLIKSKTDTEITELKKLTELACSNEEFPEEFRKWTDKKIVNWLRSEPKDLYKEDLSKYFYLTRESLDINISITDSLSKSEIQTFNNIIQGKRSVAFSKIIKDLKDDKTVRFTKILDALIERFKEDIALLEKIQFVYIYYPDYRSEIKDRIKKFNLSDFTPVNTMFLNGIYRSSPDEFNDVIQTFKDKEISDKVISVICNIEESNSTTALPKKK